MQERTAYECAECGAGTLSTCHDGIGLCDHHKVLMRPLQCQISAPDRGALHRCVECAWIEKMPETPQDVEVYLYNVLFWSAKGGWDMVLWDGQPGLVSLIASWKWSAAQAVAA